MGDILQFPFKENTIRTREDAVDHLANELAKLLPEYDLSYSLIDHAKQGGPVEMPADCPD